MKSNGSESDKRVDDLFDWDFEVSSSIKAGEAGDAPPSPPPSRKAEASAEDARSGRQRAADRSYRPEYGPPPRRPAAERENAFNVVAWLLEGASGLMEELQHNDLGLSEEFWTHAYAARQETLLALRAALDDLIARSASEREKQAERAKRRQRRGGIDIEF